MTINMVLNPRKCEFMNFGRTSENELFTYHEIRLKKTATKELFGVTMDRHFNFNEHITNIFKSAGRNLNALSRVSSLLSFQQKKVVSNSFISKQFSCCPLIWLFSFMSSYRKIKKVQESPLLLCQYDYTSSYDERLNKKGLVNIHVRSIQQLMIEIFKYLKDLPLIMNEISMLRNTPYYVRKPRDLDSQLPKTMCCGIETMTCRGPQLSQQLTEKIFKNSSSASFYY